MAFHRDPFDDDQDGYRAFVLRVAAAASLHESKQCRFGPDCIP